MVDDELTRIKVLEDTLSKQVASERELWEKRIAAANTEKPAKIASAERQARKEAEAIMELVVTQAIEENRKEAAQHKKLMEDMLQKKKSKRQDAVDFVMSELGV